MVKKQGEIWKNCDICNNKPGVKDIIFKIFAEKIGNCHSNPGIKCRKLKLQHCFLKKISKKFAQKWRGKKLSQQTSPDSRVLERGVGAAASRRCPSPR
jgi:hypothetical protein